MGRSARVPARSGQYPRGANAELTMIDLETSPSDTVGLWHPGQARGPRQGGSPTSRSLSEEVTALRTVSRCRPPLGVCANRQAEQDDIEVVTPKGKRAYRGKETQDIHALLATENAVIYRVKAEPGSSRMTLNLVRDPFVHLYWSGRGRRDSVRGRRGARQHTRDACSCTHVVLCAVNLSLTRVPDALPRTRRDDQQPDSIAYLESIWSFKCALHDLSGGLLATESLAISC